MESAGERCEIDMVDVRHDQLPGKSAVRRCWLQYTILQADTHMEGSNPNADNPSPPPGAPSVAVPYIWPLQIGVIRRQGPFQLPPLPQQSRRPSLCYDQWASIPHYPNTWIRPQIQRLRQSPDLPSILIYPPPRNQSPPPHPPPNTLTPPPPLSEPQDLLSFRFLQSDMDIYPYSQDLAQSSSSLPSSQQPLANTHGTSFVNSNRSAPYCSHHSYAVSSHSSANLTFRKIHGPTHQRCIAAAKAAAHGAVPGADAATSQTGAGSNTCCRAAAAIHEGAVFDHVPRIWQRVDTALGDGQHQQICPGRIDHCWNCWCQVQRDRTADNYRYFEDDAFDERDMGEVDAGWKTQKMDVDLI